MQEYDELVMRVEGHLRKYEGRNREVNKGLANSRAEFIKSYIISNYDIDPVRIITCDENYDRPIASNDAENSWLNQRIYALISNVE